MRSRLLICLASVRRQRHCTLRNDHKYKARFWSFLQLFHLSYNCCLCLHLCYIIYLLRKMIYWLLGPRKAGKQSYNTLSCILIRPLKGQTLILGYPSQLRNVDGMRQKRTHFLVVLHHHLNRMHYEIPKIGASLVQTPRMPQICFYFLVLFIIDMHWGQCMVFIQGGSVPQRKDFLAMFLSSQFRYYSRTGMFWLFCISVTYILCSVYDQLGEKLGT